MAKKKDVKDTLGNDKKVTTSKKKNTTTKNSTSSKNTKKTASTNLEDKKPKKEDTVVKGKKEVKSLAEFQPTSKISVPVSDGEEHFRKLINIVVVALLIIAGAYILTLFILDNKDKEDGLTAEEIIQYDHIMIGSILNQSENDYYVLITSDDDIMSKQYSDYIYSYKFKQDSLKVYTADYSEGYNLQYLTDASNLNVSNISDLKITGSTLLKVSNKAVSEAYEGKEAIINALKNLIK